MIADGVRINPGRAATNRFKKGLLSARSTEPMLRTHPEPAEPPIVVRARQVQEAAYAAGVIAGQGGKQLKVLPSGTKPEVAKALEDFVAAAAPTRTLETGFAYGLSSLAIMLGAIRGGRAEGCFHAAIDPFARSGWHGAGIAVIENAGLSSAMKLIEEDSAIVLPRFVEEQQMVDLAFVDGGHLFENIFIDLYYLGRIVKPGGMIVVDDLWMPAVKTAVAYFTSNLSWKASGVENAHWLCSLQAPGRPADRAWDHFVKFDQGTPSLPSPWLALKIKGESSA